MKRHKSIVCSLSSLVCVLWFISVATEWSFQSTIEQTLTGEHVIKSSKDTDKTIPVSQFDPNLAIPSHIQSVGQQNDVQSLHDNYYYFVCHTAPAGAKRHQPILIVANARTGSNLFFSFIHGLAKKQQSQVSVLHLYEVFGDDSAHLVQVLSSIVDQIRRGCGWETQDLYAVRNFASPEELFSSALVEFNSTSSQQKVIQEFQQVFDRRNEDPAAFIQYIHRVPSRSPQPFFVLKVFPYHIIDKLKMTVADFASIFAAMDTKYVILWRRNMLEIFVSFQIALKRKKWTNVGTTENDAIDVKQDELEWFLQRTTEFYAQARDYFDAKSIPYEEFEYNRDMSDEKHQLEVAQRIQTKLLQQVSDEQLIRSVVEHPGTAKQASVPLSQQIVNWNDVASWGYSESPMGWPDLFENREQPRFVCDTAFDGAKRHQPILMIANSRTGSNLLFSFIGRLSALQKPKVDVLLLYELFAVEKELQVEQLSTVIDQIRRGCGWDTKELYFERKFASPEELFATALVEFNSTPVQQQVLRELQQVFNRRYEDPAGYIKFIHRVPSQSTRPYFALKVFPYHVFELLNTTVADFASIFSGMDPEHVVLWRRNVLEIFVSMKIADQQNAWTLRGTTKDDAIEVNRDDLEWYIQNVGEFYSQARDYFASKSIVYELFEYDRDLIDESNHADAVQRIQTNLLHQTPNEELVREVLGTPSLAKQALVPLSQQIVNWNDVASWGYSESPTDWPDLFASPAKNDPLETKDTKDIRPVGKLNEHDDGSSNFICDTAPSWAKRHQPILIVGNARTGSNLFFSFIKNLALKQESEVDVLNLYEFFGDDMNLVARVLSRIIDHIQRGCGWNIEQLYADRKFSSPEQVLTTALSEFHESPSQHKVLEELQQVMSQRLENPAGVLQFIHRIPSRLPHDAYFVLKVFPDQVTRLMKTTITAFVSLFSDMDTQYVILWRRNMLEIFVSFQIAKQMKKWTNVGTTEDDAIEVDRSELELFIQKTTEYYSQARDYFETKSIPYVEFEYDRDLSNESSHANVVHRIQTTLLHQPVDVELVQAVLNPPGLAKQAAVPLSQQIVNWQDVASWGYSESSAEWPDLFSKKPSN